MKKSDYKINYKFEFKDESSYEVNVVLDENGFSNRPSTDHAEWTALENNKCSHCPLNSDDSPHCPLATNVEDLIGHFQAYLSYEETDVTVTTDDRTYQKSTSMQVGLYSLLGLFMATSRCPTMRFLRPMARFHLPFSNTDETIIRSVGFYLLRQYFKYENNETADFHLKNLETLYAELEEVNQKLLARINSYVTKDSNQNAVVILDSFATILTRHLEDQLEEFKYLFEDKTNSLSS